MFKITMEERDMLLSTLANTETLLNQIRTPAFNSALIIVLEQQLKEADEILMSLTEV